MPQQSDPAGGVGTHWLTLLTAIMLAATGCDTSQPPATLRLAVNPWPGYAFVYLAEEKGFFRDEGVSVRLVELASLADGRRIFEQGQADIACCTLVEVLLMNDADDKDPVRIVSAVDYSDGSDMLLGSGDLARLDSISGCRIGVEPESVDGLSVFLALKSVGLSMDDVTLVPLAQSEMVDAMKSGRVDAVQTYPPTSDLIQQLAEVHRLWDSSRAPATILDVIAVRESFLKTHERQLDGIIRAYVRAQDYYRKHKTQATEILARRCGVTAEALSRSFDGIRLLCHDETRTQKIFHPTNGVAEEVAEALISIGMLQRRPVQSPFDPRLQESSSR